ncbi:MAG: hypothetical protein PHD72_02625 [Patescibacteria group bacterium]|nr:hypothetical protein [Patescibacteria group bacterium]
MDITRMLTAKDRRRLKTTVLRRKGGGWSPNEAKWLTKGLNTNVSAHKDHPEYLVLWWGHFSNEALHEVLLGCKPYTVARVIGLDDKRLPFVPEFTGE